MPSTNSHLCVHCHQPLIYIKLGQYYCLACDNYRCYKFREPQGYIPRDDNESQEKPKRLPLTSVIRPNCGKYNREGVANYHYARSLDIPSVVARDLRHKSHKEIKKAAKELVRA